MMSSHKVEIDVNDPFIASGALLTLRWLPINVVPIEEASSYRVNILLRTLKGLKRSGDYSILANNVSNNGFIEVTVCTDLLFADVIIEISLSFQSSQSSPTMRKIFQAVKKTPMYIHTGLRHIYKLTGGAVQNVLNKMKEAMISLSREPCINWAQKQSQAVTNHIAAILQPCPCMKQQIMMSEAFKSTDSEGILSEIQQYFYPNATCFQEIIPRDLIR